MNKVLIAAAIVFIVGGVTALVLKGSDEPKPPAAQTEQPQEVVADEVPTEDSDVVELNVTEEIPGETVFVTYVDGRFDPEVIGPIAPGTSVTFINESDEDIHVASADHPTHTVLPGFNSNSSIAPGGEYTFTFEDVGTWEYHNHLRSSQTGSVIVAEQQ